MTTGSGLASTGLDLVRLLGLAVLLLVVGLLLMMVVLRPRRRVRVGRAP